MSLRIVPLPIEQAKVPVFRVVCSRAPKALAWQDTWVLRGAACRRVVRFWNTAWHHYAPTDRTLKPALFALARAPVRIQEQPSSNNATRFLHLLYEHRGLETALILLHATNVSEGYAALWERGRLDLTVEAVIHDNQTLLSRSENFGLYSIPQQLTTKGS